MVARCDVRLRHIQARVPSYVLHLTAACARLSRQYARRYFAAIGRHSESTQSMCASADGSQGHAVAECMSGEQSYVVADIGQVRFATGSLKASAGHNSNYTMVVYSIKSGRVQVWKRHWAHLQQASYRASRMGIAGCSL